MRPRKASASNGIVNQRMRLSHQTLLGVTLAIVGLWMVGSLIQEIALARSLSQQAHQLRDQNTAVGATNQGYRSDIAAVSSGAAAEEEARKDGYARGDEKLYIIATPPAATPPPNRPRTEARGGPLGALGAAWRFVTGQSG
jgi:hypothetical protein